MALDGKGAKENYQRNRGIYRDATARIARLFFNDLWWSMTRIIMNFKVRDFSIREENRKIDSVIECYYIEIVGKLYKNWENCIRIGKIIDKM